MRFALSARGGGGEVTIPYIIVVRFDDSSVSHGDYMLLHKLRLHTLAMARTVDVEQRAVRWRG